jgi:transcriptional regulator with XRE-family HTH domain
MTTKPKMKSEAEKLVEKLFSRGMTQEEIAFRLRVSLNSIIRWRKGVTPQPGHFTALRDLVAATGGSKRKKVPA